ncbi:uncharacterized protein LOC135222871 [Macrobrachium nipponense]|uniref:uncharacterized protein LOC135222871 n=1 Tax=Macrobrachium nipponense TaxID=159736 RepID=UPI0030C87FA2
MFAPTECQRVSTYDNLDGFCYVRGVDSCDGSEFRRGCSGRDCALCVTNTSICLEKPVCSDANGICVKNVTECDRLVNELHCHGDGCACCKDGCQRQPECADVGGYCLATEQRYRCPGTNFNLGCLGTDCFCCVPDTSECIAKRGCLNGNGYCLKKANWTSCDKEIDALFCLGDDCACCREKKCERNATCSDQGGYCFRNKTKPENQHVCEGRQVPGGCGDSDCICCVPDPVK